MKHSKNRNAPKGSKASMLIDEHNVAANVKEEQFEDDQTDHNFAVMEKHIFKYIYMKTKVVRIHMQKF